MQALWLKIGAARKELHIKCMRKLFKEDQTGNTSQYTGVHEGTFNYNDEIYAWIAVLKSKA